jgi:hypothetical protein
MGKLKELTGGASVRGITVPLIAIIVNVNWYRSNAIARRGGAEI